MSGSRYKFDLTGRTALLMHADDIDSADALEAWRKSPSNKNRSKAGDDRSPPWTWQSYLYTDGDRVTIPSQNLAVAMRKAGAQKIMKKQTTFKEITQSGIIFEEEFLDFRVKGQALKHESITYIKHRDFGEQMELVKSLNFCLFSRRATVGTSKHIRVRPRFNNWTLAGYVTIPERATSVLTLDVLQELFGIAGYIGIGDWRPGSPRSPGPFGMFDAKVARA